MVNSGMMFIGSVMRINAFLKSANIISIRKV